MIRRLWRAWRKRRTCPHLHETGVLIDYGMQKLFTCDDCGKARIV